VPQSDLHRKQKRKNIAMLIVLLVFMALIYAITVMRMTPA